MKDMAVSVLVVLGGVFALLGALGVLRMPDVFCRMQSTTKATTLGVGLTMLAMALHFADIASISRAVVIVGFVYLTAPIGAHMLGRGAYRNRVKMDPRTEIDDLASMPMPTESEIS